MPWRLAANKDTGRRLDESPGLHSKWSTWIGEEVSTHRPYGRRDAGSSPAQVTLGKESIMARCWPCSIPIGSAPQHCRGCDCCRPLVRPDLHDKSNGGGGSSTQSGSSTQRWCALFLLATVTLIAVLLTVAWA